MLNINFSQPILAIDCGTSVMSLALKVDEQVFEINQDIGAKQSEHLLPALRDLYLHAGVDTPDLAAIVLNQGPGAFTGLRVGGSVAQGLAAAFAIPLIGVPSLDALAYSVPPCPCVLAAMDARMGEVFYAFFDTERKQRLSDYCVGRAVDIRLPEKFSQCVVVGNIYLSGSLKVIDYIEKMPKAQDFLNIASSGRYAVMTAENMSLLYVRDKIALTAVEQAQRKKEMAQ
ncbi:MAG: tRNA (adenosine(37)-N6)-threonylcarbamoyltransferase complex dimerization subunit type 1 TsaB [Neisseriaceae bacterium]|nr:tRNA (adenosine(37)-N6)-threonylcarbamoyltransferase complex dimerization subunit type 1 TsaB [Neisseriaceae bacterium]